MFYAAGLWRRVEKVCLQSAVVDDPEIIRRLSEQFGSQSIIVSVDIKRNWRNRVQLHDFRAGGASKVVWTDFVRHAVELGAGEILFNAVHRDGTMSGMDVEAIRAASKLASVPLIAVGGARNLTDFRLAIDAGASAVSAGAFFVFHGPHRAVLITYPSYDELQGVLDDDEK
jgi:imidazole glycerol-phosphate synthase subunit HisF